jgi:hypothetical protein
LVDLVQSEYAKRVIMFGVQKPVDIVGGYCGVHIFPLAELELFSITGGRTAGSHVNAPSQLAMGLILLEPLA